MATPDILYHYCSTEAFHAIITSKSIRLSMLDLSNDSEEGRWVFRLLEARLSKNQVLAPHIDQVGRHLSFSVGFFRSAGFCMSEEADQLSQWRGYADDGRGFSIGFHSDYFRNLCNEYDPNVEGSIALTLAKVLYANSAQDWGISGLERALEELVEAEIFEIAPLTGQPENDFSFLDTVTATHPKLRELSRIMHQA